MVSNCLVCCLLCLAIHYTCDLDNYVGLIQTEVMLCLLKMNRLGCGLVAVEHPIHPLCIFFDIW